MWQNSPILHDDLPQLEESDYIKIDQKYLYIALLWRIVLIIILGVALFTAVDTLQSIPEIPDYLLPALFVIYGVLCLLLLIFGFQSVKYQAYLLRQKDLSYQKGWINQTDTSVPYNRIQHVEVTQGLIERWLDLSRVKVFTAGGSSSDIQIPGLTLKTANGIKTYLLSMISHKVTHYEEE